MASEERLISSTAEAYRNGGEGDAYDYFTSQLPSTRKAPDLVQYITITTYYLSIALFLGALMLYFVISATTAAVVCVVAGCVLSLTATALGTFAPKR